MVAVAPDTKCPVCDNTGFYPNDGGFWDPCPRCEMGKKYAKLQQYSRDETQSYSTGWFYPLLTPLNEILEELSL